MEVDIVDYICLVIWKTVVEVLIGLVAKVIAMKTVAAEGPVVGAVDLDQDDMHRKMASMRQGIMILQVAVVGY